jgi:hypothetical protein
MRRRATWIVALLIALLIAGILIRRAQRPTYQPVYFPYDCEAYWWDPYCWRITWP